MNKSKVFIVGSLVAIVLATIAGLCLRSYYPASHNRPRKPEDTNRIVFSNYNMDTVKTSAHNVKVWINNSRHIILSGPTITVVGYSPHPEYRLVYNTCAAVYAVQWNDPFFSGLWAASPRDNRTDYLYLGYDKDGDARLRGIGSETSFTSLYGCLDIIKKNWLQRVSADSIVKANHIKDSIALSIAECNHTYQ